MGINKLNFVIKRNCGHLFPTVPISTFAGSSVAVDFSILIHQCHSSALRDAIQFMDLSVDNISDEKVNKKTFRLVKDRLGFYFLQNKIRPILITEGKAPELKKLHTGPKRKQLKIKALESFRDHLAMIQAKKGNGEKVPPSDINRLIELKCQTRDMNAQLYNDIVDKLETSGYSILQATGEAEELCSELCRQKMVLGVYSTDTDNIIRRCPLIINSIYIDENEAMVADIVKYDECIPKSLGFSYSTFVDFCIMMGCDYNERVKGMREDHIREYLLYYKCIEKLEEGKGVLLDHLNYKECRLLFSDKSIEECCSNHDRLALYFGVETNGEDQLAQ